MVYIQPKYEQETIIGRKLGHSLTKLGYEARFLLIQNEMGIERIMLAELFDLTFFFEP